MIFNELQNKKEYYNSLNELKNNHPRNMILKENKVIVDELKQLMFDKYNVEDIYLYGDILEKNKYNVDALDLLIYIDKTEFEKMVDDFFLEDYNKINFKFNIGDVVWNYKNKKWEMEEIKPLYKLSI